MFLRITEAAAADKTPPRPLPRLFQTASKPCAARRRRFLLLFFTAPHDTFLVEIIPLRLYLAPSARL
ncbi:hypothetical protein [Kingella potus]|uniref:hypothetical protein n=1 Tax=Kingella potus TaxID=265175 RepID=UPI001558F671|nr:hypothetical protein [Kingella potus]UOP01111.1 hypothetical protein LVJ84_01855 [Kingella potus]